MIPFNQVFSTGKELQYIGEAIASGHLSGDGLFTRRCHELLEHQLSVPRALLTTSCTDALEMAALLLEIQPGDEVIIPSFAFVSIANAFALRGARIIFADIRPDTMNLDERALPSLITERTRAIVALHYAGVGCEMDPITGLADANGIAIVEDNAHGLFGTYRGKLLGTFGKFATLSFHETKNFTSGEGGCLLVNERSAIERAEVIREKGTNRSRFFRGEIDKYSWIDLGSSYLPSELVAAFLLAQLESRDSIQQSRKILWHAYYEGLQAWAAEIGATLPFVPDHCGQSYHMFHLLTPRADIRQRFIEHLRKKGIHAVFHYLPLHESQMGRRSGRSQSGCPVSIDISDRLVRLPFFTGLTADAQAQVIDAVLAWRG